jgi:hypothetical protein
VQPLRTALSLSLKFDVVPRGRERPSFEPQRPPIAAPKIVLAHKVLSEKGRTRKVGRSSPVTQFICPTPARERTLSAGQAVRLVILEIEDLETEVGERVKL